MDTLLTESMISGFSSSGFSSSGFYREASSEAFFWNCGEISAKTVRSWCY
jgi:hypothetical protein